MFSARVCHKPYRYCYAESTTKNLSGESHNNQNDSEENLTANADDSFEQIKTGERHRSCDPAQHDTQKKSKLARQ